MPGPFEHWPEMPSEAREKLHGYRKAITNQLGPEMQSLVLYGSLTRGEYVSGRSNINLLLTVPQVSHEILKQAGNLHRKWSKEHIVAPLIMTLKDIQKSFDVFPLEFLDMSEHHVVLDGPSPFTDCRINDQRLAVQCEQEIRGNLIRVRQRYVEGWVRIEAIQALLPISLTTLIPCLRGLYRVLGFPIKGGAQSILDTLPTYLGMEAGALQEVWLVKRGTSSPGQKEWPRLMERYLDSLTEVIQRLEAFKQEGKLA